MINKVPFQELNAQRVVLDELLTGFGSEVKLKPEEIRLAQDRAQRYLDHKSRGTPFAFLPGEEYYHKNQNFIPPYNENGRLIKLSNQRTKPKVDSEVIAQPHILSFMYHDDETTSKIIEFLEECSTKLSRHEVPEVLPDSELEELIGLHQEENTTQFVQSARQMLQSIVFPPSLWNNSSEIFLENEGETGTEVLKHLGDDPSKYQATIGNTQSANALLRWLETSDTEKIIGIGTRKKSNTSISFKAATLLYELLERYERWKSDDSPDKPDNFLISYKDLRITDYYGINIALKDGNNLDTDVDRIIHGINKSFRDRYFVLRDKTKKTYEEDGKSLDMRHVLLYDSFSDILIELRLQYQKMWIDEKVGEFSSISYRQKERRKYFGDLGDANEEDITDFLCAQVSRESTTSGANSAERTREKNDRYREFLVLMERKFLNLFETIGNTKLYSFPVTQNEVARSRWLENHERLLEGRIKLAYSGNPESFSIDYIASLTNREPQKVVDGRRVMWKKLLTDKKGNAVQITPLDVVDARLMEQYLNALSLELELRLSDSIDSVFVHEDGKVAPSNYVSEFLSKAKKYSKATHVLFAGYPHTGKANIERIIRGVKVAGDIYADLIRINENSSSSINSQKNNSEFDNQYESVYVKAHKELLKPRNPLTNIFAELALIETISRCDYANNFYMSLVKSNADMRTLNTAYQTAYNAYKQHFLGFASEIQDSEIIENTNIGMILKQHAGRLRNKFGKISKKNREMIIKQH